MKKLSCLALFSLLSFSAISQTKQIELFDLVSALAPVKSETTNVLPWKNLPAQNSITLKEKAPVKAGVFLQQSGSAAAVIDGKKFICEDEIGGAKGECKWAAFFQGKTQGYDHFGFSTSNFPVHEPGSEIKMLFPKDAASFKLLSKCIEGATYWMNLYEVIIPSKKTFWMISTYESMSATASQYETSGVANNFYFTFYFDRKMAEETCAN